MSDHAHDDEVQRMSDLFDRATKTTPALSAVNRLAHCHLVDRLTNGDLETALEIWADPGTIKAAEAEFHSLDDDGRADLAALIVPTWSAALTVAVHHLWASCRRLGFDPTDLDAEHVALTATMFLGGDLQALIDDVAEDGGA